MNKPTKDEVVWNLINSGIAGGLVLLGGMSAGEITAQGICAAVVAGLIVFLTKFREYWLSLNKKRKNYIFTFI